MHCCCSSHFCALSDCVCMPCKQVLEGLCLCVLYRLIWCRWHECKLSVPMKWVWVRQVWWWGVQRDRAFEVSYLASYRESKCERCMLGGVRIRGLEHSLADTHHPTPHTSVLDCHVCGCCCQVAIANYMTAKTLINVAIACRLLATNMTSLS